jgi:glycosyltransferase involved in cell wall biosynthesis
MKILRIYIQLPPNPGGMENHISMLTKIQNESDEVTLYFNSGNSITERDQMIFSNYKLSNIKPSFFAFFIFYFGIILKLMFKNRKFDVIHIHGDWSSLIFIKILKILSKAKVVVFTIHGLISNSYPHRKFLPVLLKHVDLIFTTGYESGGVIQKMVDKHVVIQPSGVKNIFFQSSGKHSENEEFTVVTVANLLPVKNINFVIEIAKELPNIRFLIVGDGPERFFHQKSIERNNLLNVKLLGFKSPEEIKKIFDESDCFLLTSLAEGTPTSILEAMACGMPIISSNAGGLEKIINNNVNGLIIKNFDKEEFIRAIEEFKNNSKLREIISKNNIKLAEHYKWENVAFNITHETHQHLMKHHENTTNNKFI